MILRLSEAGKAILFSLLLAMVPVVLFVAWSEGALGRDLSAQRKALAASLESYLRSVQRAVTVPETGLFRAWQDEAHAASAPAEVLGRKFAHLQHAFPGVFEFVLFDSMDRVVASSSDLSDRLSLLNDFGKWFTRMNHEEEGKSVVQFSRFRSLFGPLVTNPLEHLSRTVFRGALTRKRAFFSVAPRMNPGESWFIVWISIPDDWERFSCEFFLYQSPSFEPGCRQGILDLTGSPDRWTLSDPHAERREGASRKAGEEAVLPPLSAEDPSQLVKILCNLGSEDCQVVFADGESWGMARIGLGKVFLVRTRDQAFRKWEMSSARVRIGAVMIGFVFFPLLVLGFVRLRPALSLSSKLLFLFAYAAAVPLFLFGFVARDFLEDRGKLLERDLEVGHERIFGEMERGFLDFQTSVEARIESRSGVPLATGSPGTIQALEGMASFSRDFPTGGLFLFDRKGKPLYERYIVENASLLEKAMGFLGRQIAFGLGRTDEVGSVQPAVDPKDELIRMAFESFGIDADYFLGMAWTSIFGVFSFQLGHEEFYRLFSFVWKDIAGGIPFCGMYFDEDGALFREFLNRGMPRFHERWPGRLFYCRGTGYPEGVPGSFPFAVQAEGLREEMAGRSLPLHTAFLDGEDRKLHSVTTTHLYRTTRFHIVEPDSGIRTGIRSIRNTLCLFGSLVLILGCIVGIRVSRHLLKPIARIGEGLEAMRARNFRFRLEVNAEDELGRLSRSLDDLMEGMADLEIARVVQDAILPQTSLAGDGWEVFGTSLCARRVGGDYFDYFPLPDGRWLIILGDATGHGVSAALVVGMAKAIVSHPGNPNSPGKILALMDRILGTSFRKRVEMNCCVAIFDPRNRNLVVSNAGPFPPLVVCPEAAVPVGSPEKALGSGIPRAFGDGSLDLKPSECLVLYSEGIFRAIPLKEEVPTPEVFQKALPTLVGRSARDTETNIRNWHSSRRGGAVVPEDDVTIVILQRAV